MILLFSNKKNLISETNHFEQQNSFYLSTLYFTRLPYSHLIEKEIPSKIDLGNHP
ncbi:hypothetical protein LMANV2_240179 [Leptospira interrogans serovar Manilae]|uniref:Uncharacterized protein n=1 Tax=Leptospira interrogans serovar Manilae TaxID=214675 RepID=A0AAQ1P025_LEPIR|nr:hypothetical protein LMANV2_240179 [Leptospira interrogans serovar Manilae]